MRSLVGFGVCLILLLAGFPAAASAQTGVDFSIRTVRGPSGDAYTPVCYSLVDGSNEGCDENGDGTVLFQDVQPGTYTVAQRLTPAEPGGMVAVGDFTVTITDEPTQFFTVVMTPVDPEVGPVDIIVRPVDVATGETIPGMCFILEGGSREGCDENGNGEITFDDMTVGNYLLTQTQPLDGYVTFTSSWATVGADDLVFEPALARTSGEPATGDSVDIALVTREPGSSDLVTGTCYVLVGFSNEGCDENSDGRVTFDDVPPGYYDIEQTRTPNGFDTPEPFPIFVSGANPAEGIIVKQARVQNESGTRNVSILLVDSATGDLVTNSGVCITLGDATNSGCDDNADGQVDFLDVPFGTYIIEAAVESSGDRIGDGPTSVIVDDSDATNVSGVLAIVEHR